MAGPHCTGALTCHEADEYNLVIDLFCISDVYRSRGFGEMLLGHVHHWAHNAGYDTVSLDTVSNNYLAQKFYERHGYEATHVTYTHKLR